MQLTQCNVDLNITNLRANTVLPRSKMTMADFILNGITVPCVIQRVVFGRIKQLSVTAEQNTGFLLYVCNRTAYTKMGYVSILVTCPTFQVYVYIHRDYLVTCLAALITYALDSHQKK